MNSINKLLSELIFNIRNVGRKGFFHLLSANILLKILGFGSQIFLISLLTPIELGQIKTMQTFNQMAILFAVFGFTTATLKQCSENRPMPERAAILRRNINLTIISTILVLLALFFLAKYKLLSPDNDINVMQPWFMLAIPATVVISMLMSYLQAIKQVKKIAAAQIIQKLVGIVLIIGFTWLYGITGFIVSTILTGYLFIPLMMKYIGELIFREKVNKKILPDLKTTLPLAGWSFMALFTHRLSENMDIFLLNYISENREAFGFYSIATIFMIPLREIIGTVRTVSLPYLVEKQSDKQEFLRVIKKYRKLMLLQAVGLVGLSLIFVPIIINFFYGEKYSDVSVFFSILVIGYLFHSYMALLPTALITLGKMKYNFYSALFYLPIALILHYVLITHYGVKGAAFAQVGTSVITMMVITFFSNKAINEFYS